MGPVAQPASEDEQQAEQNRPEKIELLLDGERPEVHHGARIDVGGEVVG